MFVFNSSHWSLETNKIETSLLQSTNISIAEDIMENRQSQFLLIANTSSIMEVGPKVSN